jgi:endo-1,4-beta-xylanase
MKLLFLILFTVITTAAQTLRQEAERAGVLVSAAVRPAQLSEVAYASTLAREFNMLEPANDLKWAAPRPDQATFDFTQADRVVGFARVHGMKVRGHTLVWGWSNPPWLTSRRFNAEQLSSLLHEHITRVVGHYRGQVFAWDVLNEAIDERGHLRSSIWYDQPGIGMAGKSSAYIEQVFRWAHAADPNALFFYNDGGGETLNPESDAMYAMIRDFKTRGVPIDGVGLQMHIDDLKVDFPGIAANIAALHGLGCPGSHHGTGRGAARRFEWQCQKPRRSRTTSGDLSAHCASLLCTTRLHGHPNLGFHRQIFVDSLPLERNQGSRSPFRS